MRPPGFEPGSSAWQADVLTKLDYGRNFVFWLLFCTSTKLGFCIKVLACSTILGTVMFVVDEKKRIKELTLNSDSQNCNVKRGSLL